MGENQKTLVGFCKLKCQRGEDESEVTAEERCSRMAISEDPFYDDSRDCGIHRSASLVSETGCLLKSSVRLSISFNAFPWSLPATGPIPVSVSSSVDVAAAVQQREPGYLFMSVRQEKVEPSLTGIL